jgi:iron complex transport system permease protein
MGWAVVAAGCLCVGSTGIGWPNAQTLSLRIQFVFIASIVGVALAGAGVTYQAVLRNPLADPYLLGVSSGASLAVYLWRLAFNVSVSSTWLGVVMGFSQQATAIVGATLSVAAVFLLSQRRGRLDPITMLLVGVIVNAVNGALFLLAHYIVGRYTAAGQTGDPLTFLVGAFNTNLTTAQQWSAAVCVMLGLIVLLFFSGSLAVAGLGDDEVESLGVNIHRTRWITLIAASFITASAVAVSGPIGFVGLVCPHIARLIVGADTRRLLPVAAALGAALLAFADAASRRLGQLPVGVLTGLLGGPFFLVLLWRHRARVSN